MTDGGRRLLSSRRRRALAGTAGGSLAALAYLALWDPHRPGAPLACPVKLATGLDCPGCGGLRMLHDLLHGRLGAATHDNPFLLMAGPLLGALLLRSGNAGGRPGSEAIPPRLACALAFTAGGWMLVRNLPGWPLKPVTATAG